MLAPFRVPTKQRHRSGVPDKQLSFAYSLFSQIDLLSASVHIEMEDDMTTATLTDKFTTLVPAGFAASAFWSRRPSEWAFGLCTEFASGGSAALALGPLQVHFEWSIL
jgi:hypothetical protein